MSEHAHEDAGAAGTEPEARLAQAGAVPVAAGPPGSTAHVLHLQRAAGNANTARWLLRQPHGVGTTRRASSRRAPARTPGTAPAAAAGAGGKGQGRSTFTPLVPMNNVDELFRVGATAIADGGLNVDHMVVIAGSVYIADRRGRRTSNFGLRGNFSLNPGTYLVGSDGSLKIGYLNGELTYQRFGYKPEELPEDLRKKSIEREKALKARGEKGPTIFMHDWVDMTEEQERATFDGGALVFVPEPTTPYGTGGTGAGGGADRGTETPTDKPPTDGNRPSEQREERPPALAQPGHGSSFGTPGGRRAELPAFPARLRPMSSLRGGVLDATTAAGAALPFVYQATNAAATYQMVIDYTAASPGFLLGQASAASRLHLYRWELWDISQTHQDALAEAAELAARSRPGTGRTIGATEGAQTDLDRATDELAARPRQYAEDQARALAEKRYFDALAGEINQDLYGLEVMFRYGKEVLGLAADAMETGRERRLPIPAEGVYLLRCVAHYDPYAGDEGRPTRAPSVATMVVKVKPREWLSRDALADEEANLAQLELNIAILKARIAAGGANASDADRRQLGQFEAQLVDTRSRAYDLPVAMLERQLAQKRRDLEDARKNSSLYQAGYGRYDDTVRGLERQVEQLQQQLDHARTQGTTLRGGDATRALYRLNAVLVSRVTGQTYPLLLHVSEPKEVNGRWECRMADASSRRGKYYDGVGGSAMAAVTKAIEELAGDNLDGFGEGSLSVRVPARGPFAALPEGARTVTRETRARDWAAARQRLDELATVVGILALVAVPGAGEAALILGAALAASRIVERIHHDTLFWDAELVSDMIAILSAATAGGAAAGRVRVIRQGGKFALVPVQEGTRIAQLSKLAQRANDWFLDPANIAWGNVVLLDQLADIAQQEARGGLTSTEARRQRASIMANAVNTNLALVAKLQGPHEPGAAPTKGEPRPTGEAVKTPKPESTAPPPRDSSVPPPERSVPHEGRPPSIHPEGEPPSRRPEGEPPSRRPEGEPPPRPPEGEPPSRRRPEDEAPLPLPPILPPVTPEPPRRPAANPREAFAAAVEANSPTAVAEARRVILELRDWKGALREFVRGFPEGSRERAMTALAEARSQIVNEIVNEAKQRFGVDQRNFGTPGFGSDIDLTITPRERLPGFSGPERPVGDQIRAAADAADYINRQLRERVQGEPDRAIDTNVYSYIGEDRVRLDTPDLRARGSALEAEVGFAEAMRGLDAAQQQALRQAVEARLGGGDPVTRQALADLQARMQAGRNTEAALRAEFERTQGVLRERFPDASPQELQTMTRDALLAEKKRVLADLFSSSNPDMIAILRVQAEIRWFAPDAYAGGAAFEYAVGFGQARRSAGADAARARNADAPTRAEVLADLADSWARERSRPFEQRLALFAAAATSQLGMLGAHTHGAPADRVKAAAKYAARILDLIGYANLGSEGPIPRALADFVASRHPDVTPAQQNQARLDLLARFAEAVGMGDHVTRADGKVTRVSDELMLRFVGDAQRWATEATARLLVTERTYHGATPDPAAPPTAPPPPARPGGDAPPPPVAPPARGAAAGEPAAGGLRGNAYALTNEVPARGGGTIGGLERTSGPEKVGQALKRLGPLTGDAQVQGPTRGTFTLSVPDPAGGSGRIPVAVEVRIVPGAQLTGSVHGAEGGAARLVPSLEGGQWRAVIEVNSRLHPEDLPHVIRHEANELAGLVSLHPRTAPAGGFDPHMRAGVFQPGFTGDLPFATSHDRAAALELKGLLEDYTNLVQQGSHRADARWQSVEGARAAMGLNDAVNLDHKMRLLREAGVPTDEIMRLARVAGTELLGRHQAVESAAGRGASIFDPALVAHVLVPAPQGGFRQDGLHGGHTTRHLLDFCRQTEFHVHQVAEQTNSGTTWRRFEQWQWIGTGPKPTDAELLPHGPRHNAADWVLSEQFKTTADDPAVFLREAEAAWRAWVPLHDGGPTATDDRALTGRAFGGPKGGPPAQARPGGPVFAGFFEVLPGPRWRLRTIFVDQTFLP